MHVGKRTLEAVAAETAKEAAEATLPMFQDTQPLTASACASDSAVQFDPPQAVLQAATAVQRCSSYQTQQVKKRRQAAASANRWWSERGANDVSEAHRPKLATDRGPPADSQGALSCSMHGTKRSRVPQDDSYLQAVSGQLIGSGTTHMHVSSAAARTGIAEQGALSIVSARSNCNARASVHDSGGGCEATAAASLPVPARLLDWREILRGRREQSIKPPAPLVVSGLSSSQWQAAAAVGESMSNLAGTELEGKARKYDRTKRPFDSELQRVDGEGLRHRDAHDVKISRAFASGGAPEAGRHADELGVRAAQADSRLVLQKNGIEKEFQPHLCGRSDSSVDHPAMARGARVSLDIGMESLKWKRSKKGKRFAGSKRASERGAGDGEGSGDAYVVMDMLLGT
jgi:hypothetical protein